MRQILPDLIGRERAGQDQRTAHAVVIRLVRRAEAEDPLKRVLELV